MKKKVRNYQYKETNCNCNNNIRSVELSFIPISQSRKSDNT